jgi:hypothetical protein
MSSKWSKSLKTENNRFEDKSLRIGFKSQHVKSDDEWKTLCTFPIKTGALFNLILTVVQPPDSDSKLVNVRWYFKDKPTRRGAILMKDEFEELLKKMEKGEEMAFESKPDVRKVTLTRGKFQWKLTVTKNTPPSRYYKEDFFEFPGDDLESFFERGVDALKYLD